VDSLSLHGFVGWLNNLQLLVAGFALMLASQQIVIWRWEGRRSSARPLAVTSTCVTAALVTNWAVLRGLSMRDDVDALLFLRSAALTALTLSIMVLIRQLDDRAWLARTWSSHTVCPAESPSTGRC
jgi:hypothetical protein